MKKTIYTVLMSLAAVALSAPLALAQEGAEQAAAGTGNAGIYAMVALGCGLGIGLAALGTGIGQGIATNGAMHGISRNPGASGKIMTSMIIGLAMIESLCIYGLVVVLIMLFANPYHIF
jgi:F-type H+-transporting ATPase subunit c